MDQLRLDTLAVRVVEWHNRHPLARRIEVRHVQSIGYVALPFRVAGGSGAAERAAEPPVLPMEDAAPGASLRERAMARSRQGAAAPESVPAPAPTPTPTPSPAAARPRLEANFTEDFLGPIRLARVKRWAQLHGREMMLPPADAPVRQVAASGVDGGVRLYALTALIETAGQRSRMLVGAGDRPAILGRRLGSPQRLLAAAALVAVVAGAAWLMVGLRGAAPPQASVPAASAAARAPSAAAISASAASAASAPTAAAPASAPLDVEPQLGRVTLPALNLPRGDGARNQAREQRLAIASAPASAAAVIKPASAPAAARPAAPEPPPAKLPEGPQPPERSPAMTAAATPGAPTFAVSTRILRTRAESEQVMVAMQALLATTGARGLRVEIVPNGADWRVVGWPFARRDDAERARALLASRGMRVQVVDF